MLEEEIDDTHLCIKCSTTIVGLDNYVQHRKNSCSLKTNRDIVHTDHPYGSFDFPETTSYHHHKSEETEKTGKSLSESYDLPYDLGADVFFSSLELQSSSKRATLPTGAPSSSVVKHNQTQSRVLTRKATAALLSQHEPEDEWIEPSNNSDNLMKAVHHISGNKKCDSPFKLIIFHHDSPEPSDANDDDDDEDEDYETAAVPANHTGGKWKPDNQPGILKPNHHILLRNSPSAWDDRHQWDDNTTDNAGDEKSGKLQDVQEEFDHDFNPPPEYTKGKWVPGTKVTKLGYKNEIEIEKIYKYQYWCNTCNRKLASKLLYERHLKSNLHLKRSEPENELEQATVKMVALSERMKKPSKYMNTSVYNSRLKLENKRKNQSLHSLKLLRKRKRRKHYIKCETCKTRLPKYLLGKHLISHYHYRRMVQNPSRSYDMIIKYMDKIVKQAPYQCQPCHFYTNTESNFLWHWNSRDHQDTTEGPGRFWCSFCKFECEDNNQMRRHLLSLEHKDVVLAINRTVPIIVGKKLIIECVKCKQVFRYNIELRKHAERCSAEPVGTASNDYQSKFSCNSCNEICKSRLSLQRHEFVKHDRKIYFCSICKINFETADDAKKHRSTMQHKVSSDLMKKDKTLERKCNICGDIQQDVLQLKEHIKMQHPEHKCLCPHCGKSFIWPQELGRHVRDKQCQSSELRVESTGTFKQAGGGAGPQNPPSNSNLKRPIPSVSATKNNQTQVKKTYSCEKCDFRTLTKAELLYHEIFHGNEIVNTKVKISCPICEKKFHRNSLRCHLRQHTGEKMFSCEYCHVSFTRKHNLKNHILNHGKKELSEGMERNEDNSRKNQCETCGKFFKNRRTLRQHINIHGERDRKFSCPIELCIFIGRNTYDLKAHLSVHSMEKNFKCDYEGCNYVGKTRALLKKHATKHKPYDRKFLCSECNFSTRIPGHMKRHMRIHTGEKPYKCPHCTYASNNLENVRKHVISTSLHPGKCLYECKLCDSNNSTAFKTNFQREYRAHLVTGHRIETNLNEYLNL